MDIKDTIKKVNEFIKCNDFKRAGNLLLELDKNISKGSLDNIVDRFKHMERPISKDMIQYDCFISTKDADQILSIMRERNMYIDYRKDDLYHIKKHIDYRMYSIGQANLKEILDELLYTLDFEFIDDEGIKALVTSKIERSKEILDGFKTGRLMYSSVSGRAAEYYINNILKGNLMREEVDKRTELLIREAFRELAEELDKE